jgi:hypothetical protein
VWQGHCGTSCRENCTCFHYFSFVICALTDLRALIITSSITQVNNKRNNVQNENRDMNKLPEVIILRCFSELDLDNLRCVARVNKQWNRVAYDPSLWTFIDLHGLSIGHEDFSLFIDRICMSVIYFDLRTCRDVTSEIIQKIVTKCSRLKTLRYSFYCLSFQIPLLHISSFLTQVLYAIIMPIYSANQNPQLMFPWELGHQKQKS